MTALSTARHTHVGARSNAAEGDPARSGPAGDGRRTVVLVGGGPRTVSLLERFAASVDELLPGVAVDLHVVDPHPVGGGRIWRRHQSPLLWMNSMAADVTIFTDASVTCTGPIVPGPSLAEWVVGDGAERLERAGLGDHVRALGGPSGFASRAIQGEYLGWAFDRVLTSLPDRVSVTVHTDRAVDVADSGVADVAGAPRAAEAPDSGGGAQRVTLASGVEITADVVVLAQGYLDREPTPEQAEWSRAADEHGLTYVGPGYTADLDLDDLRADDDVIVGGLGLAFIDLAVLLGEGRGGRFTEAVDGRLTYHPSGREPHLHVGSRRGVPYHAKLGYSVPGDRPVAPRYFTTEALDRIGDGTGPLDFDADVRPLIDIELTAAHYSRLFEAHPARVRGRWEPIAELLERGGVHDIDFVAAVEAAVPDPTDRFVIADVDRPLRGRTFRDRADLAAHLVDHIETDLARRADPQHSPDLAVFNTLLSVYAVLSQAITSGRITAAERVSRIESAYHGFFSFLASGPPPRRLRELVALHEAGVVSFLGPDLEVGIGDEAFVARSPVVPGAVRARAFVEARLPRPDVLAATDPVVRSLLAGSQLAAERLTDTDGRDLGGGQLLADPVCRAVRPDGSAHPRRFLLGPAVSGSAGAGGFSRPHFNGPGFRQNDIVARHILELLAHSSEVSGAARSTPPATPSTPTPATLTPEGHHHAR